MCQESVKFVPLFSFQPFHCLLKGVLSIQMESVFKSQLWCCLWLLVHAKATAARLLVQPEILLFLRQKRGDRGFLGLAVLAVSGNPA